MNNQEYERLVKLHIDSVYRVALNGCQNPHDAEDIVQSTFMKLLERKDSFNDDDHARRWLIRVCVNECKNLWRSPWRSRTTSLEGIFQEPIFSSPEKSELYYAVNELPAKYRTLVYLYYFEGYTVKEIAAIMSISETAVQTRLYRARAHLKDRLKEAWQ